MRSVVSVALDPRSGWFEETKMRRGRGSGAARDDQAYWMTKSELRTAYVSIVLGERVPNEALLLFR